jgi:hypothetical protein
VALTALCSLADGLPAPQNTDWQLADSLLRWTPVADAAGYVVTLRHTDSAAIEQMIVVGTPPVFQWTGLAHYDFAAVAAIDRFGRIGALGREVALARQF